MALPALVLLGPLYGGGALLIREVTRRSRRGWPTMLLLAIAYGVLEEGVASMSLFNPNYAGAHLLDNGYIPELGIALPWTVGVLRLHTVWSISVPIALVEELVRERRTEPWLGRLGLVVTSALFLFGMVANTSFSIVTYHFVAPPGQFAAVAVICVALVNLALSLGPTAPRGAAAASGWVPSPWLVGLASFAATSIYKALGWVSPGWPAWVLVVLILGFDVTAVLLIWGFSRLLGWGDARRLALAGGALMTYAWSSFPQVPVLPVDPMVDLVGNATFALGAVVLLVVTTQNMRRSGAPCRRSASREEWGRWTTTTWPGLPSGSTLRSLGSGTRW